MVGEHHEQTPGDSGGHGNLASYSFIRSLRVRHNLVIEQQQPQNSNINTTVSFLMWAIENFRLPWCLRW